MARREAPIRRVGGDGQRRANGVADQGGERGCIIHDRIQPQQAMRMQVLLMQRGDLVQHAGQPVRSRQRRSDGQRGRRCTEGQPVQQHVARVAQHEQQQRVGHQRAQGLQQLVVPEQQPVDDLTVLDTARRQWRASLPARGVEDGQIVDWLLFWDNQLLQPLRALMPDALLLFVLRDPLDMLLDWLAFGATASPLAIASPLTAANWLASVLDQIATLHEQDLHPHRLLRLDAVVDDAAALTTLVGNAIGATLTIPADSAYRRFPPGHWRGYAEPLAAAFDVLTPAARRLGYE